MDVSSRFEQLATRRGHVEDRLCARSDRHGKMLVRIGFTTKVQQAAISRSAVDGKRQILASQRHRIFQPHEAEVVGNTLQGKPLTCGLPVGHALLVEQGQRKAQLLKRQPGGIFSAASAAYERVDAATAKCQPVNRNFGYHAVGICNRYRSCRTLKGKASVKRQEAEHIQRHLPADAGQGAIKAVHVQGEGVSRTHRHVESALTEVHHQVGVDISDQVRAGDCLSLLLNRQRG